MKTYASTLTNIARQYGMHRKTLKKLLKEFPQIRLNTRRHMLTPKEVGLIYDCLGPPPDFQKGN